MNRTIWNQFSIPIPVFHPVSLFIHQKALLVHLHSLPFPPSAEPSAVVFLLRFPTLSPLKSFPARPVLRDSSDLPRLIRWDDYEELPQRENIAPPRSAVMVRKRHERCFSSPCACFWLMLCPKCVSIWKCNREKIARWDHFKRDYFHFPCINYYCELSFTLFCTQDYTVHWKTKKEV